MTDTQVAPTTFDFSAIGGFPVKKLQITIGLNQDGRPITIPFITSETRKLFVMPGKFARMEVLVAGKIHIAEFALGPLGWEYER